MGPARARLIGAAVLCVFLTAEHAHAQYFGRNKVQYDSDRVLVHTTDHFDIYHASDDTAAAQIAGRLAERWHARLSIALDHTLRGRQPIVLYGSHRRFEQTNVYGGFIDESTGGFTDARKRRIVLPFAGSLAETDHVLGHEIVHAFQFDIADQHRSPLIVPLWFVEGMAEYLTLGPNDPHTSMWMRDAVASGHLPTIRELSASSKYFPYRWGAAVWAHLVEEFGDDLPAQALRGRRDVQRRLQTITGRSLDELTRGWHEALRTRHGLDEPRVELTDALLSSRAGGGRLNLAASLSPDASRVIFLSERDQFSIDLFLADAATGRVIRKLITTAASAEFESLQYLHSAGTWDATGSRFALATIVSGRPALQVIGIDNRSDTRQYPVTQVDEIFSPTWSPDGQAIAFSAIKSGFGDLFTMDLASGRVRQLTDDAYADLQPAWSPDGRTIAFTTDRFTTSLTRLTFGPFRIGLLDTESGAIMPAAAIPGANHFDPAWVPGGRAALYVIADPGGVRNLYRLADGDAHRMTDVATGVSGVTRTSPALSVAAQRGTVAFSVFHRNGYQVHTLDPDAPSIATLTAPVAAAPAALADIDDAIQPVPRLPALAVEPAALRQYQPRLALEGIGAPYFSAGGGPLGGYVAGGTSLLFGDLLGDEQLMTTMYVSSRLNESAFGAMYVNRRLRWNWGITLEQLPELRLRTGDVRVDPESERVISRDRVRTLWMNRQIGGFAAYPFSRSQRIEFSGGFRQIASARERRTETLSTVSGLVVDHETEPVPGEPPVGMAEGGVALVGDTTIFGATGPLLGTRYRLQTSVTVGDLKYTSVLADYRRYLMPVRPYTLAFRVVHSGRYGVDAGDMRLRDIYLGTPSLVRGHNPLAVLRAECPGGASDCPALNSLLASRVLAAKVELRAPLWSTLRSSSRVRYGPVPMDAFLFADAGAGWGGERRFGPGGSDGRLVRSVGGGLRANVVGMILEVAAIRPLDLRGAGWTFGFNITPGF